MHAVVKKVIGKKDFFREGILPVKVQFQETSTELSSEA